MLFNTIDDKLREALDADPRADLSKYESVFGITIVDVAFIGAASKDQEVS